LTTESIKLITPLAHYSQPIGRTKGIHFVAQKMTSTDSANEIGLSILSRIQSHSNLAQYRTSGSTEQAPLIYCSLEHLQPCPLADATEPSQCSHHPLLQFPPKDVI